MNVEGLLLIALFLALLALPLVPGIRELVRPRDDRPLEIDVDATLDPRQPGRSFREGLAPFRARAGSEVPFRGPMDLERPSGDAYEVHRDLVLPAGGHGPALTIVLGKADVGERARLGELYVQDDGRLAAGVRVRAVATDADLRLGPACVVEQWLDVEGTADVGAGSKLGHQASAAGELRLGAGAPFVVSGVCRFRPQPAARFRSGPTPYRRMSPGRSWMTSSCGPAGSSRCPAA